MQTKSIVGIVGVLVAVAVIAFVLLSSFYTRVPDSRLAVSEAVNATAPLRERITERIAARGSISGVGAEVESPRSIDTRFGQVSVFVSLDGTINLKGAQPPFAVEMLVVEKGEGIHWICRGTPAESLPRTCRQ